MIRTSIILASTLAICTSIANAKTVTCSDRNVMPAVKAFSSKKVAESWYPPVLRLTDTTIQWGIGDNKWYKPEKNHTDGYPNWKSFVGTQQIHIKYDEEAGHAIVTLRRHGNYKNKAPVRYTNCTVKD